MPDDPVIVTGGSLKFKAKGSIKADGNDGQGNNQFRYENSDGKDGRLSGVTVKGTRYDLTNRDEIVIHYEVP